MTEASSIPVPASLPLPHQEEGALACRSCQAVFDLFTWKHFCRNCGRTFCSSCSSGTRTLVKYGYKTPQRVCNGCYIEIAAEEGSWTTMGALTLEQLEKYARSNTIDTSECPNKGLLIKKLMEEIRSRKGLPLPAPPVYVQPTATVYPQFPAPPVHNQQQYPNMYPGQVRYSYTLPSGSPIHGPQVVRPFPTNSMNPQGPTVMTYIPSGPPLGPGQPPPGPYQYPIYVHTMQQQPQYPHQPMPTQHMVPPRPPPVPPLEPANVDYSDASNLRIAELRSILDRHHIEHSTVIEKEELVRLVLTTLGKKEAEQMGPRKEVSADVDRAVKEDQQDVVTETKTKGDDENELCVICLDEAIATVFLECGHMACCRNCSGMMVRCPLCRRPISRIVNVFHANK